MRILIADDEMGVRISLSELLKTDHDVLLASSGDEALRTLEKTSVDLIISDHQMPGLTGLELLKRAKELSPQTSFMMMTAFGTVEQAVQAIQLGADDYFLKPFEFPEILHRVSKIADLRAWRAQNLLRKTAARGATLLTGRSGFISRAQEFVSKVSSVPSPVLILGPSGSGKEVLAKSIHEQGPRADRPFIAINCASLGEQLMESELFGHEKGAFTGATTSKPGKFELAAGGTLFLDEIGELSPSVQAKLLRVLQEKEFFRVGGTRQIKTDARVIAATHRPLKKMVADGQFREDLFFRLDVLTFEMAPLRERKEDLPELMDFFWQKHCAELGRKIALSKEARETLSAYSFPGNIRELNNLLERLVVLAPESSTVGVAELPSEICAGSISPTPAGDGKAAWKPGISLTEWVETLEARAISEAMRATGGNQIKAAELLKITRGTLQYKLKKYGFGHSEAA